MTAADQFDGAANTTADRALDRAGLIGVGAFSFGLVAGKALANAGLLVIVVAFSLMLVRHWRTLRTDPLLRLSLPWLLWCSGLSLWAAQRAGTQAAFDGVLETSAFVFVPAVAWATRGRWDRILICAMLSMAGLAIRTVCDLDFDTPGLFPYKFDALGMSRNRAVLFLDAGMLVCITALLYAKTEAHLAPAQYRRVVIAAVPTLVLFAAAWHAAPSRASFVAFPIAASLVFFPLLRQRSAGAGMVLLALAVLMLVTLGAVMQRFAEDQQTWAALLSGQWQEPAIDSAGLRLRMWHLAWAKWMEFPLTGLGPRVAHLLADASTDPSLHEFSHFHSGYVEALLRTGLTGFLVYGAAATIVVRTSLRARADGSMPKPLAALFGAIFFVFLALNLTETVLYFQQGWQFLTLLGGLAHGYRWRVADQRSALSTNLATP